MLQDKGLLKQTLEFKLPQKNNWRCKSLFGVLFLFNDILCDSYFYIVTLLDWISHCLGSREHHRDLEAWTTQSLNMEVWDVTVKILRKSRSKVDGFGKNTSACTDKWEKGFIWWQWWSWWSPEARWRALPGMPSKALVKVRQDQSKRGDSEGWQSVSCCSALSWEGLKVL